MTIHKYKKCDECGNTQTLEPVQIGGTFKWIELCSSGFTEEPFIYKKDYCSEKCIINAINKWSISGE
ncbi:MAG: hypothetical protein GY821_12535 [Gammaproteobacteria bacterium]|nr:hypothetical protein [Gammaproteobacteria bacterium]